MPRTKPYYKVYIENAVLILADVKSKSYFNKREENQIMLIFEQDQNCVTQAINDLEKNKYNRIIIFSDDIEMLWSNYRKNYSKVTAAGGLIVNKDGKVIFIYRRKKWDLPKGKMEYGEGRKETAIREVQEECGLQNVTIQSKLCETYHTYGQEGKRKLKRSHWYLMRSDDRTTPQAEEDIEICEYMSLAEFYSKPRDVYSSIWEVLQAYHLHLMH